MCITSGDGRVSVFYSRGLYAGYEGYYGVYFLFVGLLVGYMLLFTFSFSFLLFVTDLFSVRVFILALGV